MLKYLLLVLLTMVPVFACATKMKQSIPPLKVVSYVDLNKYGGTLNSHKFSDERPLRGQRKIGPIDEL